MIGCECGDKQSADVRCIRCGHHVPSLTPAPHGWEEQAKVAGDLGAEQAWQRYYEAQEREKALREVCQAAADHLGLDYDRSYGPMKALAAAAAGVDPTPYLDREASR